MHYSKEDIAKAREMDLLTYLACFEPDNLKQVSANVYSTVEHDSLMINNGKWCWFSRGIGGRTALDYLIKVKGLRFPDAVARIIGNPTDPLPLSIRPPPETPKIFIMPEVASNPSRAFQYLVGRGIDPEIVQWCIDHRLIFETAKHLITGSYSRLQNTVMSFSSVTIKTEIPNMEQSDQLLTVLKAMSKAVTNVFLSK